MTLRAQVGPDGWTDIMSDFCGMPVCIVSVRPVGTLQLGHMFSSVFSARWIPDLLDGLEMAAEIAADIHGVRP